MCIYYCFVLFVVGFDILVFFIFIARCYKIHVKLETACNSACFIYHILELYPSTLAYIYIVWDLDIVS